MRVLKVSVEIEGVQVPAGTIVGDGKDMTFSYDQSYLGDPKASALSVSLPLSEKEFSPAVTGNFFDGLLPEGFMRKSVAKWIHSDESDSVSILEALGRECPGAVRISETEEEECPGYIKLSGEQVRALASEGVSKSTELVKEAHLSLTGTSGKVGLLLGQDGSWYLPKGSAPSSHIVKQSHIRLGDIVVNEQLCIRTAAELGINVPESFIINCGGTGDGDILYATRRYDRFTDENSKVIDGQAVPYRLHQEDFAQALGIPSAEKYEPEGKDYLKMMVSLLLKYSSDPIRDREELWRRIVYSFLVGNTDGHLKNYSLLHGKNLNRVRLAPAYDIVSTAVYPASSRNMAFNISGDYRLEAVTMASFVKEAEKLGLGRKKAMEEVKRQKEMFSDCLMHSAGILKEQGFEHTDRIAERILSAGGIATLKEE